MTKAAKLYSFNVNILEFKVCLQAALHYLLLGFNVNILEFKENRKEAQNTNFH